MHLKHLLFKNHKEKGKEEEKDKNWYGITSIDQHTERIKAILRREGLNIYRKGGEKLEWKVKKKRMEKKTRESNDNNEEGAVYQINCQECDKMYIGETKFKIGKRMGQHKKDIQFRRENSAVVRHVLELGH